MKNPTNPILRRKMKESVNTKIKKKKIQRVIDKITPFSKMAKDGAVTLNRRKKV